MDDHGLRGCPALGRDDLLVRVAESGGLQHEVGPRPRPQVLAVPHLLAGLGAPLPGSRADGLSKSVHCKVNKICMKDSSVKCARGCLMYFLLHFTALAMIANHVLTVL